MGSQNSQGQPPQSPQAGTGGYQTPTKPRQHRDGRPRKAKLDDADVSDVRSPSGRRSGFDQLEEMLREQQEESKSAMDALSATLLASVEANTSRTANNNAETMRKMDTIYQTSFFAIEATQREMCARLASLELAMESNKKQVVDLGGVVEVVSKSPAAEILESDAWNREVDHSVLRIHRAAIVSRTAAVDALCNWMDEASLARDL